VQPEAAQKTTLASDVRDLLANKPWVVLCAVGIAALTFNNIRGTVTIFYFENVVPGGKPWFGPVMTSGAVAFIVGVMLTPVLSKRFGKRNFYMGSMSVTAVLTAAFYFVPADNLPFVWAANTLINLCAAPTAPLVWAMYADTADYAEWKNGRRATGLVFSAASFAQKLGWAIGGAGAGWLLSFYGYQANAAQSAQTIDGILKMMSLIPAVGAVAAVAALWFYELDETTVDTMGRELAQRRQARPDATEPTPAEPAAAVAPALPVSGGSVPAPSARTPVPTAVVTAATTAAVSTDALSDQVRSLLLQGLHGLCFSPFMGGQAPGTPVSEAQIRQRLQIIQPHTRWVRSFSCGEGHQHTPRIAHELGLKTLVGAWLGTDAAANEREIASLIHIAQAGHADMVAVGNEVLLRGDLDEDALLAFIARVRQALPGLPVGCVDAYCLFEQHPRLVAACDMVLANCYPFWEGSSIDQALPHLQAMVARTVAAAQGKRVIISETGWPDQGQSVQGAEPSVHNAMCYLADTQHWAQGLGIDVFYFAAFDEDWKQATEGDVGARWGLWDHQGAPKFSASHAARG
jgi:exo-beta-1,3-glucanase (GH17 family)